MAEMDDAVEDAGAAEVPSLTVAEWEEAGRKIARDHSREVWRLGDWWIAGTHSYGVRRMFVEAPDWTGPTFQSCADAGMVAKAFPPTSRRSELSFSHHRLVLALPEEERAAMLDRAVREKWSCRDLRTAADARMAELRSEFAKRHAFKAPAPMWRDGAEEPSRAPAAPQRQLSIPVARAARQEPEIEQDDDPLIETESAPSAATQQLESEADGIVETAAELSGTATAFAERWRSDVAPVERGRAAAALRAAGEELCRVADALFPEPTHGRLH